MSSEDAGGPDREEPERDSHGEDDELRRQGWLASVPKRTIMRALLLMAALAGILYLRGKTAAIAGCMSDAFRAPVTQPAPPSQSSSGPARVRLAPPSRPPDTSAR